ncbi:MAG: hypothetical protein MJ252_11605 [archaeon]|nr:hypothetical protein [archaeon]
MKAAKINSYMLTNGRNSKKAENEKNVRKTPTKLKEPLNTQTNNSKREEFISNTIRAPKKKSFIDHNQKKNNLPNQRALVNKTPTRPRSPKLAEKAFIKKNTFSEKNKEELNTSLNNNSNTINKGSVGLPRPFSNSIIAGIPTIKETIEEENKNENKFTLLTETFSLPKNLQWSTSKSNNLPNTLISCPKCHKIPLISLAEKEMDKIKIHCPCSFKGTTTMKEFISENKRPKSDNKKCLKHSKKNKEFCINCQKWLCEDCVSEHEKYSTHILIKNQVIIEISCKDHRNKPFEFFCLKCHVNLCKDCLKLHTEHKTINLSEYLSEEKYNEIEKNYNKALTFIDVYMKNLKDSVIKELETKILQVESAYTTNNQINHTILDLFSILMNNYSIFKNSYFTSSNVINNCNFTLERIVPKHFEDKVTRLVNYYNNTFITKSNGKIDVFDEYYNASITLHKKLNDNTDSISSIILLNDGRLATSSSDKTIRIINLKSYKTEAIIEGHIGPIKYLSQMKNNKLLSCSDDQTIKIWTLKGISSFNCEATLSGHESGIFQVIPITKNRIASCSEDTTIKIWSSDPPYNCIHTLTGHCHGVIAILLTKEGELFSSATELKIWDLQNYNCKETFNTIKCSYRNSMIEISENRVIIGEKYGITIMNSKSYEVINKITDNSIGWVNAIIFIRPQIIVCGCDYGLILQINSVTYKIINKKEKAHDKNIRALLKVGENMLVSADGKGFINFWNLNIEKCTSSE